MRLTARTVSCVAIVGMALTGVVALAADVRAQSPEVLAQYQTGPHTTEAVEETVVGVEVVSRGGDGSGETHRGSGFLLRADGFLLASVATVPTLPKRQNDPNSVEKITVTLFPGTEKARRLPAVRAVPVPNIRLTDAEADLGYIALRIQNFHAPALKTLLPDALPEDADAQIYWCAAQEDGTFGPVQHRAVRLKKDEKPEAKAGDKKAEKVEQETLRFAEPLEGVPTGAVVVGPEGKAIGLTTWKPADNGFTRFVTFAPLHQVTNCVTPVPTTDAEFEKRMKSVMPPIPAAALPDEAKGAGGDGQEAKPEAKGAGKPGMVGDMVRVAGGPVRLPPVVQKYLRDMRGDSAACVAPFLIDQYEVTNGQYLAFWNALPEKQRNSPPVRNRLYPVSWAEGEKPFPAELNDVPVLGVTIEAAREYAKWVGKRLPTPAEWLMAAFGSGGGTTLPGWAQTYLKERQETWAKVREAHLAYLNSAPNLIQQINADPNAVGLTPNDTPFAFSLLPWFFWWPQNQSAAAWSKNTVLAAADELAQKWVNPLYVLPIGSRPFDVSPYGARDMILNGGELVCPMPGNTFEGQTNALYVQWKYSAAGRLKSVGKNGDFSVQSELFLSSTSWGELAQLTRRLRSGTHNARPERGDFIPADSEDLMRASSGLMEVGAMLRPLDSWAVQVLEGPTLRTTQPCFLPDNALQPVVTTNHLDIKGRLFQKQWRYKQAASFPLWQEGPRYARREMGRDVDVDPPAGTHGTLEYGFGKFITPMDTTLLPCGFRCAR